ncbi:MAG: YkgJ family cysteine cluster protein [Desulfobacterales bacterium]|nr:YkgJ family cysteine cluster protein [Desulfobacterales bacterium]
MKYIDDPQGQPVAGRPIGPEDTFRFRCHPQLACFNRCCHNLNLFVYPYDVLRLKRNLGISADQFIETYVDVVLREGNHFPEVVLRMAAADRAPCPFLTPQGCRVYADRPHTCRLFPMEQGARYAAATGRTEAVYFLRPPAFCLGPGEDRSLNVAAYIQEQQVQAYDPLTMAWAEVRRLFRDDPWGLEGPNGPKAKMAFMAAYNLDRFREFLFGSTFLKRYRVAPELVRKIRRDEEALLAFGFDWIRLFVFGIATPRIRPKH